MKPSPDYDEAPEVTAADLRRAIVRRGFQPIAAGPDAPEYMQSMVRRAGGRVLLKIRNPNAKPRAKRA